MGGPHVIVSLDVPDRARALSLADRLEPSHCRLKVGKALFTQAGPGVVEALQERGYRVFLDLKYHDIPHTVAKACAVAARLGVWMINVHTCGGRAMLNAARAALHEWFAKSGSSPLLIGVTVLTSMRRGDLEDVGVVAGVQAQVARLSRLAKECGLDGVVCSGREAPALRRAYGRDFCLVTPGIRPAGSGRDDQQRVMTPAEARRGGSDYLVIGRPIIAAEDPLRALRAVTEEIEAVR